MWALVQKWQRKFRKLARLQALDPRSHSFQDCAAAETESATIDAELSAFTAALRPQALCYVRARHGVTMTRVVTQPMPASTQAASQGTFEHKASDQSPEGGKEQFSDGALDASLSSHAIAGCLFLNFHVAGVASRALDGMRRALERTDLILVDIDHDSGKRSQTPAEAVLEPLIGAGFLPVRRARARSTWGCKMLLLRRDIASRFYASTRHQAQGDIPALIPCFNNPTYCAMMLDQLWAVGFRDIRFVDNASDSADMRSWLNRDDARRTIVQLPANVGPNAALFNVDLQATLPRHFCITDPDISFNVQLPSAYLQTLQALTKKHAIGKAGFALDLSRQSKFVDKRFDIGGRLFAIPEWEERFWRQPLHATAGGDMVFHASVDTTFALVDKKYYNPAKTALGVRVAGRFTAEHLPWLAGNNIPQTEAVHYVRTQRFSNYTL